MSDVFTKKKRAAVMAAVRSKGNKATEINLAAIFRRHGIKGWRRHLALPGRPDFAFRRQRVAVFVDGCFWHGCQRHFRLPLNHRSYWREKISRNVKRDAKTTRRLRKTGWRVLRIWEHDLRRETQVVRKIVDALAKSRHDQ